MKKIFIVCTTPLFLYSNSLSSLVDSALDNKLIESNNYKLESINDEFNALKSSYMPQVSLVSSYSNNQNESMINPKNSIASSVKIDYTIYDGGAKESKYEFYNHSIDSINNTIIDLKNKIALDVIYNYYSYYSLISKKEAKLKEIEQLDAQYIRLKKFLNAGTTTIDEVQKIVSRVELANLTLHEIELDIIRVLHNLEQLTSKEVSLSEGSTIEKPKLVQDILRADLKAMESNMNMVLSNSKIVDSNNYPTITLQNSFNYYNMNYDNKLYDIGVDNNRNLTLNLSWNLYDFGKTVNSYESIYKEYESLKAKYEYEKSRANIDLKLALKSFDIAKLKIESASASLKASNLTYDVIKKKYKNGLVDNVTYLEALSEKYSAISALKVSKYDLEIKKADIIYYSGRNLEEYIR